ncbi:MAG: RNA 2'-phosphotransferase [Pseudomonadota bacterium]
MNQTLVKASKFLSLVLRHKPATIGLSLDEQGWIDVDELLAACEEHDVELSRELLHEVVATNNKQRFVIRDGRIRASQGHSISIDLDLAPQVPPDCLYHGTASRFLDSIRAEGLVSKSRQHVHLSLDEATAVNVGKRHGAPVVLTIDAKAMHEDGCVFYVSENGVWLTARVATKYIRPPEVTVA